MDTSVANDDLIVFDYCPCVSPADCGVLILELKHAPGLDRVFPDAFYKSDAIPMISSSATVGVFARGKQTGPAHFAAFKDDRMDAGAVLHFISAWRYGGFRGNYPGHKFNMTIHDGDTVLVVLAINVKNVMVEGHTLHIHFFNAPPVHVISPGNAGQLREAMALFNLANDQ